MRRSEIPEGAGPIAQAPGGHWEDVWRGSETYWKVASVGGDPDLPRSDRISV